MFDISTEAEHHLVPSLCLPVCLFDAAGYVANAHTHMHPLAPHTCPTMTRDASRQRYSDVHAVPSVDGMVGTTTLVIYNSDLGSSGSDNNENNIHIR